MKDQDFFVLGAAWMAGAIFLTSSSDRPLAGALTLTWADGVWDCYAATAKSNTHGASYLLLWKLMQAFARKGYRFYDLGGVEPGARPTDPGAGLMFFKSRFDGECVEFSGEHDLVFRPLLYRAYLALQPWQVLWGRVVFRRGRPRGQL